MKFRSTIAMAATFASLSLVPASGSAFPEKPSGPPQSVAPVDQVPKPLEGIEIEDKRGAMVPKDLRFRDQEGREVGLDTYLDGRPVLLVFAYYECPMLCTVVLNGLKDGLKDLAWTAGKEFRVVTVSFDQRDDVAKAAKKRQAYAGAYGRHLADHAWDFLVGDEASVRALTKAVGFTYRWDPKTEQFAHPAGAFVLTPEGRLSQVLHGIQFSERDLRLALTEASRGKLGTAWDRVLLLCYHYDPNEHSYVLAGKQLMRAGGGLTALVLGAFLFRLWRKELKKPEDGSTDRDPDDAKSEGSPPQVPEATS